MQAALAVHRVVADQAANLTSITKLTREAAGKGADLVVFSETALTGFVGNDDPAHDRLLAQPIPGPVTEHLGALSRETGMWIAIGMYERERTATEERLYDSAILIDPDGKVQLHYRRISPQWHGSPDRRVYRQGTDLPVASTDFGTCAFLLCGDLFDDELVQRLRRVQPNWLLFPFARSYDSEVADAEQWEREERFVYADRAARAGVGALMVNHLAARDVGGCFGGALAVAPDGTIIGELPPGNEGILLVDLSR
ncbi:N-carbamoylputrescine amidase [Actinopolymorpha cephalotaxi]|uniref:N-carbamoylputrescine amidase n=1 Tax=Actinopolymorpha cephalotaxi TaxID=504797 RepID=A0A1I2M2M2_9ACTN|nr:carbon-nitrogen hydrolase family protein [Actinopolymorpha cephalotaxi]NYH81528.1 N-carbamoylputrescine amidase [Actinopolymorpha cephalotaxi]SFF84959.1 N-carbamoylputrescine amidase [Actinopolymorpha cephalotaxi]